MKTATLVYKNGTFNSDGKLEGQCIIKIYNDNGSIIGIVTGTL